jgi:DNA-binding NarL/FixJ family response regulator
MIRILLCDGQKLLRAGMRMLIEEQSDFAVVGEAEDPDGCLREMRRLSPDITLADLDTMRSGSVEPRAYFGGGHVVVLAHDDDCGALMHAVRAGARGVILKSSSPDELASGIRAVAAGEAWMTPAIAHRVVAQLSTQDTGGDNLNVSGLTNRELDVLYLLGVGLSNAEIAEVLVLGEATVKSHVSSVLRKLKVRNRVQAILIAHNSRLVGQSGPSTEPAWILERSG